MLLFVDAGPLRRADSPRHLPRPAVALFEAIDIAEADDEATARTGSLGAVVGDSVGLSARGAVPGVPRCSELHEEIAHEVHRERVTGYDAEHPLQELVDVSAERAVLVGGVGVVARAHELRVDPVDAAAVAEDDLRDLLLGEQVVDLGVAVGVVHVGSAPGNGSVSGGPLSSTTFSSGSRM